MGLMLQARTLASAMHSIHQFNHSHTWARRLLILFLPSPLLGSRLGLTQRRSKTKIPGGAKHLTSQIYKTSNSEQLLVDYTTNIKFIY